VPLVTDAKGQTGRLFGMVTWNRSTLADSLPTRTPALARWPGRRLVISPALRAHRGLQILADTI
jgi:hypothetical protein